VSFNKDLFDQAERTKLFENCRAPKMKKKRTATKKSNKQFTLQTRLVRRKKISYTMVLHHFLLLRCLINSAMPIENYEHEGGGDTYSSAVERKKKVMPSSTFYQSSLTDNMEERNGIAQ